MVKEKYSRAWDYALYETSEGNVLSVVFFGLVDFHRSFKLEDKDVPDNLEDLKILSEKIRMDYEKYKIREIIPAITSENQ